MLSLLQLKNDAARFRGYFANSCIIIWLTPSYRYLREVTENGSWEQWILYMLKAVEQTSRDTAVKIEAINRLINVVMINARGKTKAVDREGFVDLLFKWPYCKISIVEKELACSRITATKYLNEVAALGLLERLRIGREYYYINQRLINLFSIDTAEESLTR